MNLLDMLIYALLSLNSIIVLLMVILAFPLANALVAEVLRMLKENDTTKRYRFFRRTLVWLMIICFPLIIGIIFSSIIGLSEMNSIQLGVSGIIYYVLLITLIGTAPIFISQALRAANPVNKSKKFYKSFAVFWLGLAISISYFSISVNILSTFL